MVKLASSREARLYGPWLTRNRGEYINAGLYLFATALLLGGFVAQLSMEPKSGLVLLLVAFFLMMVVNLHDLVAHLAGIYYCLSLIGYDIQIALVEFAVPLVQALGSLLLVLATLFLFLQAEKGYGYYKLERHALNMLIAGSGLWVLGSIHNSFQIYETSDAQFQILQHCVHTPFFIGSLLIFIGSVLNSYEQAGLALHGLQLLGMTWIWLGICGSLFMSIGGFANIVKVFRMQQIDLHRLEKLRGGAEELLVQEREGRVPLILEDQRRRRREANEGRNIAVPTPYRDVLVGQS